MPSITFTLTVDEQDADLLENVYPSFTVRRDGKIQGVHQAVAERMGITAEVVDHIDRDAANNTRSNLRGVTRQQNAQNRGIMRHNTSGYIGVTYHKRKNKWMAQIIHDKKTLSLGYYDTPEEAASAYDAKALELRGDFAVLNFPTR